MLANQATLIVIPNAGWNTVIGLLLPLVTAILVHFQASDRVKAVAAIVVGMVAAAASQLAIDGADVVITWSTVRLLGYLLLVQLAAYLAAHKPILAVNEKVNPKGFVGRPKGA